MVGTSVRRMLKVSSLLFALMMAGCAHQTGMVAVLSKPLIVAPLDCIQLVTKNELELFMQNLEYCKNFQNVDGISTLMMSIYKERHLFFEKLMDIGVNVNLQDKAGTDALFYAVNFARPEMIKALRSKGARIEMNGLGVNALWVALQRMRFEVIQELNPTPEEVNLRGDDGWSSIYFAIRRKEEAILDWLLTKGVNTQIIDSEGVTPYQFAKDEVKWDYAVEKLKKFEPQVPQ